ncbi:ferritin-like domain-containing protein [Subsaximicrobium wynnwilliamsii]|uniref:Ferritin-like domain-containing protein n=1 Tax=Subsaximicrobium wynnwilliamsii TaxID=291179 RepID=A0A5C6ZKA9_9FLAO|nr:ferritin-like domain-containing protein [Subsaximicrobium wynnwilliamsii]TXD85408.1 ferritin-like domain-containing protein [Subsaximicrobium wynnwilliamsii]TXD90761.1 ferritin-like domain-containing protein [Subsaximicrobium wynnwilliamsii]TXE05268.1 ferritin-like domain-containing protein [Subsaximicrobium wynnwilliamsii]
MKNASKNESTTEGKTFKNRRQFLKLSGMAVLGSGLLIACSDDDDIINTPDPIFDLGAGNLGILNYAYALEQLEAAFYTKVLDGGYWAGAATNEKIIMEDLYNHEIIHREFFRTAITSVAPDQIVPDLEFDFSSVNFDSRESVLNISQILEDTGVKAYNGAGQLIDVSDDAGQAYLLLAGKIVSVEARHASAIRDLIDPGSMDFAGDDILINLGGTGLAYDKAATPTEVLTEVGATGFVVTPFTANNLPTS